MVYKFTLSNTKRKVTVARHGTGISETVKKFEMPFTAEKYGKSSYLVVAKNYKSGEYAITVYNPNTMDEKKVVFNCIGIGNNWEGTNRKFVDSWCEPIIEDR